MLKGKSGVLVMLLINLGIWGYFGYTFYTEYFKSESIELNSNKSEGAGFKMNVNDTMVYQLQLNYEDPFLKNEKQLVTKTAIKKNNQTKEVPKSMQNKQIKPSEEIKKPLPQIKYLGLVKNNSSGIITALVGINGQSHIVKVNETIDGIFFKSISINNITVQIGKEQISINK
ncbi:MAG: hypothetical protein ACK5QC_05345 [Bacteroidota bacterium]|jgi:hypothetical protein